MASITNPSVDRAEISAFAGVLRLVERFGLGNVLAIGLLLFILILVHGELAAQREILEHHVASTSAANYLLHQVCVFSAVQAGFPSASCDLPEGLK